MTRVGFTERDRPADKPKPAKKKKTEAENESADNSGDVQKSQ